jgi:hypothetical protein
MISDNAVLLAFLIFCASAITAIVYLCWLSTKDAGDL